MGVQGQNSIATSLGIAIWEDLQLSKLKLYFIFILRNIGLRKFADKVQFLMKTAQHSSENAQFIRERPFFALPPQHLVFDANHSVNWSDYYETGKRQAKFLANTYLQYRSTGNKARILEWGVGPSLILRHMRENLEDLEVELFGSDYNAESIKWCQKNLQGIAFVQNKLLPPTSFADSEFDFVYAISVFTHLSEHSQLAWFSEIPRILCDDGIFVFTTQGQSYRDLLTLRERSSFDQHQLVVRSSDCEGKKLYSTFASRRCVENLMSRFDMRVLSWTPGPDSGFSQDLWILKKSYLNHR